MFTQLLRFVLCCLLTMIFTSECAQTKKQPTVNKKTFNCCAPKSTPTPAPLKLADNNKPAHNTSKPAAASRPITVKSKITNDMLGYKKFGKHYPDKEFRIFINGKELVNRKETKENKIKTIKATIKDDVLHIEFRYEFNHVWRNKGKGTRRVAFKIPPTVDTVELTFNWKTDSQVLIKNVNGVHYIKDLSDTKQ